MTGKIKFKMGEIEIECEGNEKFLQEEFPKLLEAVADFHQKTHDKIKVSSPAPSVNGPEGGNVGGSDAKIDAIATNSICALFDSKTGREVALASATHLILVKGQITFNRQELLETMKTATQYYTQTMSSNLTKTLGKMIKKEFKEVTSGNYSLAADVHKKMRAKLVQE